MADRHDDRSLGDLLSELSRETTQLVRKELELAATEMTGKVKRAGSHIGVAAAGGALMYAGLLVFLAALVLGLSQIGLSPWLSALIISLLTIAVGYTLVSRGVGRLRATNVIPTRTMESLKEDSAWKTRQGA